MMRVVDDKLKLAGGKSCADRVVISRRIWDRVTRVLAEEGSGKSRGR